MARSESDREDLLREATALALRAELSVPGFAEPIVVGFRRDGSASVYFGADPVYQFNTGGELRRAYVGGLLYKAERGRLVALRRERTASAVALVRRELTEEETASLLATMHDHLERIRLALADSEASITGQVPADGHLDDRIRQWLAAFRGKAQIAGRPNVG
jgi:hypothetical protein